MFLVELNATICKSAEQIQLKLQLTLMLHCSCSFNATILTAVYIFGSLSLVGGYAQNLLVGALFNHSCNRSVDKAGKAVERIEFFLSKYLILLCRKNQFMFDDKRIMLDSTSEESPKLRFKNVELNIWRSSWTGYSFQLGRFFSGRKRHNSKRGSF
jgi:hypothetical protein